MQYIYIESNVGNGLEDSFAEVADVQFFTNKTQALAYSAERFCTFATEFLGNDVEVNDMSVYEMAEALSGEVRVNEGYWCCQPRNISYGLIKEIA